MSGIISQVEIISEKMTSRTVRRLFNDLFREEGQREATDVLPLHFMFGAYQRYRYKRRGAKYTQQKFREHQHRDPNVFTGDLRRIILATARTGVRATHRGFSVSARGTAKHPMWAQTKNELEQFSSKEEKDIGDNVVRKFSKRSGTPQYQVRRRRVIRK